VAYTFVIECISGALAPFGGCEGATLGTFVTGLAVAARAAILNALVAGTVNFVVTISTVNIHWFFEAATINIVHARWALAHSIYQCVTVLTAVARKPV
jgi:hypothetical protein